MRGRKPKPTALKELAGNPGGRPLNAAEPAPARLARIPNAPRWINRHGQKEWRRVAGELEALGLLTVIDVAALAAYCAAYGIWVQAELDLKAELKKDPGALTQTTAKGNVVPNPLVHIASAARKDMIRIMAEFGMTPSARSRVAVSPRKEPTIAEILRGEFGVVSGKR